MSPYSLALFAHLIGVIGVFAGLGTWLFSAVVLWRATRVEQVRLISGPTVVAGNIVVGSILLLAAAGIYMAVTVWGAQASWIIVATVAFVLLAPVGALVIDPRVRAIAKMAAEAPDGPLPDALDAHTHDPLLFIGLHTYVLYLVGIVALMTTKPSLGVSVLVMVVALALGLISGSALWRAAQRRRIYQESHATPVRR